jgi:hypothetical protein
MMGDPPSRRGVDQVTIAVDSEAASICTLRGESATIIFWTTAWAVLSGVLEAARLVTVTTFTS